MSRSLMRERKANVLVYSRCPANTNDLATPLKSGKVADGLAMATQAIPAMCNFLTTVPLQIITAQGTHTMSHTFPSRPLRQLSDNLDKAGGKHAFSVTYFSRQPLVIDPLHGHDGLPLREAQLTRALTSEVKQRLTLSSDLEINTRRTLGLLNCTRKYV